MNDFELDELCQIYYKMDIDGRKKMKNIAGRLLTTQNYIKKEYISIFKDEYKDSVCNSVVDSKHNALLKKQAYRKKPQNAVN